MSSAAAVPLARRAFGIVLGAAALILALAVLVPALLGYQRYVITSGSMARATRTACAEPRFRSWPASSPSLIATTR